MNKMIKNNDKNVLNLLIEKYGVNGVKNAINTINEYELEMEYDEDDAFEKRELIYNEFYKALENACLNLKRLGINITEDVVNMGVEWFELHNEFYDVK